MFVLEYAPTVIIAENFRDLLLGIFVVSLSTFLMALRPSARSSLLLETQLVAVLSEHAGHPLLLRPSPLNVRGFLESLSEKM